MKNIIIAIERIENGWLIGYLGKVWFCATEWTLRERLLDACDKMIEG